MTSLTSLPVSPVWVRVIDLIGCLDQILPCRSWLSLFHTLSFYLHRIKMHEVQTQFLGVKLRSDAKPSARNLVGEMKFSFEISISFTAQPYAEPSRRNALVTFSNRRNSSRVSLKNTFFCLHVRRTHSTRNNPEFVCLCT